MTGIDELIESLEGEAQGLLAAELNHTSTPAGPAANVMIEAAAALSTLQEQKMKLEEGWPNELTPELREILGMQCFQFIKLSQCFRAAGFDIPKRAEDEQAFFLHRLLGHWFKHGEGWREAAQADLKAVADNARALLSGGGE